MVRTEGSWTLLLHTDDGARPPQRQGIVISQHATMSKLRSLSVKALARYARPEIFNTDQGAQFTSAVFTAVLHDHHIAISRDGKAYWRDNIFVERLWRSIKYEEAVYLHAYASVSEAKAGIARYLTQYNTARPHSSLADRTSDEAYFTPLPLRAAA